MDIKVNTNHFFYTYLIDNTDTPVTGLTDVDIIARLSKAGGASTLLNLSGLLTEVDLTDEPGLYYIQIPSTETTLLGPLHVSLRPVVVNTFELKRHEFEVVSLELQDLVDILTPILGLVQHNYRMDQHIYDTKQNLVSARIRIFANATDTQAGTNEIATYQVEAVYDIQDRLTNYQVYVN